MWCSVVHRSAADKNKFKIFIRCLFKACKCHAMPYDVVQMKDQKSRAAEQLPRKRETGVRLYEDQITKLDMLVTLAHGRKDRSTLIREAIDNMLAQRFSAATTMAH
jgi:hypothetical protein